MNIILLSKADEEYLEKCATQLNFTYGIIIGQRSEPEKYVIMHLAKNGEEDFDVEVANGENNTNQDPQNVDEIDLQALTSQWSSAGRMIPGSFNVLGVFVAGISKNYANDQSDAFKSAKRLLYNVHSLLKQSHQLIYTEQPQNEYLYISYSSDAKKAVCKIYNYVATGGTFSQIEHRFVEKPFEWHGLECNYEMDDVFPILENFEKLNLETHFQRTIDLMQTYLSCSEIFIQNEIVDDTDILGQYIKRYRRQQENKTTEATATATGATKTAAAAAASPTETTDETTSSTTAVTQCPNDDFLKASILLPVKCLLNQYPNPIQVREFKGTIRFQGTVTSRIWCNPKNTIGDVKSFLRTDIMRSLMARIQVYCDGLTDSMISNEITFISEPPRRVYFNVNFGSGSGSNTVGSGATVNSKSVQFSEYIFRGEAPTVVVAQAKQILDLDITTEHIIADLEGVLDDDMFNDDSNDYLEANKQRQTKSIERDNVRLELTRSMYMLGIVVALLILVISIGMHYIFH